MPCGWYASVSAISARRVSTASSVSSTCVERGQRADVPARHDHQMTAVVRIEIEDDEAGRALVDDQRAAVVAVRRVAEDAAARLQRCASRRCAARGTRGGPSRVKVTSSQFKVHWQVVDFEL